MGIYRTALKEREKENVNPGAENSIFFCKGKLFVYQLRDKYRSSDNIPNASSFALNKLLKKKKKKKKETFTFGNV